MPLEKTPATPMPRYRPRRARDPAGAAPPLLPPLLLRPRPLLPRRAKGKPVRPSSERPLLLLLHLFPAVSGTPRQKPPAPSPGAGSQGPRRPERAGRQKKKKKKKKKKKRSSRSTRLFAGASRPAASPQRARLRGRRIQPLHRLRRLPGAAPTTARLRREGGAAAEATEWPILLPVEKTLPSSFRFSKGVIDSAHLFFVVFLFLFFPMRPRGSPPVNAPVASTSLCIVSVSSNSPHALLRKPTAAPSAAPRRRPAPLPRSRRHQQSPPSKSSSSTSLNASWVDYIPRIVENIPRRVPAGAQDALRRASAAADGSGASPSDSSVNSIVDVGGAVDALRRLVFPESLAAPSDLTLPVVIFGALGVGLVLELATLALKAVEGGGDGGGSGGGGGSGQGAAPPVDAPIVPPPPSSSTPSVRASRAPTTPSRAQIEAERQRLRDRIVAERYRGLTWLAAATAAALFTAGLLSSPTALRP